jgi:hypothetical protein
LVGEINLSAVQQTDSFIATDGKLYCGGTASTQTIAVNAVAVYGHSLPRGHISKHYKAGRSIQTSDAIATAFGGERLAFEATDATVRTWDQNRDWKSGYTLDLSTRANILKPTFNGALSAPGSWVTVFPLDSLPYTTVNGANMFWDGLGVTVEVSLDGTAWETAVRGKNFTIIPPGTTTANKIIHVRVTFPGNILDDSSYLKSLSLSIQPSSTMIPLGNRTVTLTQPAYPKFDYNEVANRSDWGIELGAGGSLTIGPDGSAVPRHPRTVEIWICKTTSTNPVINQTGTTYMDGTAGAIALNNGQWTLVHIVTAASITGNIVIAGPALIGQVVLYTSALTANDIAKVYTNYTGFEKLALTETAAISISEPNLAAKIYSYDWSITGAG